MNRCQAAHDEQAQPIKPGPEAGMVTV